MWRRRTNHTKHSKQQAVGRPMGGSQTHMVFGALLAGIEWKSAGIPCHMLVDMRRFLFRETLSAVTERRPEVGMFQTQVLNPLVF